MPKLFTLPTLLTLLTLTTLLGYSCKKDSPITLSGNYTGTFTHYYDYFDSAVNVRMTFSNDRFSGESAVVNYPIICEGTYELDQDSIDFGNDCNVPTNPGAVILYGGYKQTMQGDSLIFRRITGDFIYDEYVYRLKRQ